MHIRQKNGDLRITAEDTSKPNNIRYLSLHPTSCWSATYNAWGKKADAPVVLIGDRHYRVILEEVPLTAV